MGICRSKKQSSSLHSPQITVKAQPECIDPIKEVIVQKQIETSIPTSQQDFLLKSMELLTPQKQSTTRKGKFFQNYTLIQDMKSVQDRSRQVITAQHNQTGVTKIAYIQNHNYKQIELGKMKSKIQQLTKIDHPNIISIFEYFIEEKIQYIVTDYCSGGNILSRLKQDKDDEENHNNKDQLIKLYFKQVFSGLKYLHDNQLLHKQLKPNNILFQSNKSQLIKLVDYSSLRMKKNDDSESNDLSYVAPELLKHQQFTEATDMWDCGVILFQAWTNKHPFIGEDRAEQREFILSGKLQLNKAWSKVPNQAQKLINLLLQVDPKKRPSASDCIKHDYLKDVPLNYNDQKFIDNALQQIQQSSFKSGLRSILLSIMINKLMDEQEKEKLTLAFQAIDVNRDGKITKLELTDYLSKTKSKPEVRQETTIIFERVDNNLNGFLELNEFIQAACDLKCLLTEENMEMFFQMIDKNKNGFISINELKVLFTEARLTDNDWNQLIKEGDEDQNGRLSYSEFVKLLQGK